MLIDGWKNRGLTPEQVPAGEAGVFANGKGLKLYKAYQERLKILNAADFGDLLLENIRLFREQPEVLRQYQARFKFILVDEYQDTNVAQYLWLRLLAQRTPAQRSANIASPHGGEAGAQSAPGEGELTFAQVPCPLSRLGPSDLATLSPKGRGERRRSPQGEKGVKQRHQAKPKTSAASATTTSRSMAGAAPRSTTSCASSTIFPARR